MPPVQNQAPRWAQNLERSISLERAAIDVEKRTVPLSFSSETTEVVRWGDVEILDHSPGACNLTRINDIGVLLFNHNTDMPIGGIGSAVITERRRGEAIARFDADDESDKYFQKVVGGTLKAVSVRYSVQQWEKVEVNTLSSCGRFKGPCWIARKWTPLEISIVSVPADADVGVGRSAEDGVSRSDKENNKRSDRNMPPEETTLTTGTLPATDQDRSQQPPAAVDPQRAAADAVTAERNRTAEITALCRSFDLAPDEFIASGATVDVARKAVLERLAQNRPSGTVRMGQDEADKFRAAAVDGLLLRGSIVVAKPADGADAFRGVRLLRLAEDCVERATGKRSRFENDEDLIREALTGASAFPGILSAAANKSMSLAYQAVPTTFQLWTGTGSHSDFKGATAYRLSEADELVKMTEQGEFKHSEITEASVTKSIATFGRSFSITRRAMIDDDLGALSKIPAKYGAAARRMINKMVYAIFAANPVIENAALFHADHKNLATAAAALSVASLDKAKAAMAKQKNIGNKEYLNIQPAFLIVPSDLEVLATQLISSVVDPSKNNATPNPFANKLSVVSDPLLSEQSLTAWYLAAAPGMADTIEVDYLNGRQEPTMESQVSFEVLGMKWRIYLDVGVNLLDFRGLFKNAGA